MGSGGFDRSRTGFDEHRDGFLRGLWKRTIPATCGGPVSASTTCGAPQACGDAAATLRPAPAWQDMTSCAATRHPPVHTRPSAARPQTACCPPSGTACQAPLPAVPSRWHRCLATACTSPPGRPITTRSLRVPPVTFEIPERVAEGPIAKEGEDTSSRFQEAQALRSRNPSLLPPRMGRISNATASGPSLTTRHPPRPTPSGIMRCNATSYARGSDAWSLFALSKAAPSRCALMRSERGGASGMRSAARQGTTPRRIAARRPLPPMHDVSTPPPTAVR